MKKRKLAQVNKNTCVACGTCIYICPKGAISIPTGIHAIINETLCIGCQKCQKACPASAINMLEVAP